MTIDIPCASLPSKMGGTPTVTIVFPTEDDHRLFNAAVNIAHDRKLSLLQSLTIAYGVAADLLPAAKTLDCVDFALFVHKGIVSPYVAMIAVRRREIGEAVSLRARHVWLRTSMHGRDGEYDYIVANGTPGGRGGSYRATIVGTKEDVRSYTTPADPAPYVARVTPDWALAWDRFTVQAEAFQC